jgi:hypothetical protein
MVGQAGTGVLLLLLLIPVLRLTLLEYEVEAVTPVPELE